MRSSLLARLSLGVCLASACLTLTSFASLLLAPAHQETNASPARHPARVEDLFALHEIGGQIWNYLALSPDQHTIAFVDKTMDLVRNRYDQRLVLVDISTSTHRIIADVGDLLLEATDGRRSGAQVDVRPIWSPDGAWIYYLTNQEGRAELWRTRADGSAAEPVIHGAADVDAYAPATDGKAIIFRTLTPRSQIAAQRDAEARDGFRVDENFAAVYSLRPLPNTNAGALVSRLDLATLTVTEASNAERALLTPAIDHGPLIHQVDTASIADEPDLTIFANPADVASRCQAEACTGQHLEHAWPIRFGGENQIVFVRREGFSHLNTAVYIWRPGASDARLLHRQEEKLLGCTPDQSSLICVQEFPSQPRRLVRISLQSGALSVIYDPNPQWQSVTLPRIERLQHVDAGGRESFAHLVYPMNYHAGLSYPMVVTQYRSRGFLNGGTGGETPIFPLSTRGFFVLSFDRPEFDALARTMSYADIAHQTELDGTESGVKREALVYFARTLADRGLVDPHRIGITGMSNGAATVYDMLVNDAIFATAIASNGPSDPIAYALNDQGFNAQQRQQFGLLAPWDDSSPAWKRWWDQMNPAMHADQIHTPLLMNLPESDALLAFPLISHLQYAGKPVETYIYPGAYHLKWRPSQIWAVQLRTIDWMSFWLKGIAPADVVEAQRWQALRALH